MEQCGIPSSKDLRVRFSCCSIKMLFTEQNSSNTFSNSKATTLFKNSVFKRKQHAAASAATLSGVRAKCELFGRSHNRVWHLGIVNIFSTTLCKQAT